MSVVELSRVWRGRKLRSNSVERADPAFVRLGCAGVAASAAVVLGGMIAGAGGPGRQNGPPSDAAGVQLWSIPGVPVTPRGDLLLALALFYGGMLVLVWIWLALRRHVVAHGASIAAVAIVALAWALPFALGPPLGSRDVYAYTAQGALAAEGHDVYVHGPDRLGDDPVLDAVDPLYRSSPVLYGPVFVAISSTVADNTGSGVEAVLAFRLLSVLSVVVAGIAIVDLARRYGRDPADALVMSVGSPLVMLHLVSGAHNESVMVALLLVGVAIGTRPDAGAAARTIGIVACAIAGVIKVPAVLGAVFIAWPWIVAASDRWRRALRFAGSAGLTIAVVLLAGQVTGWGFGWVDAILATEPVDSYLSITRITGGIVQVLTGSDLEAVLGAVRFLALVLAALVVGWVLVDGRHVGPAGLGWCLVLATFVHPTTQPWYLLWGVWLIAAVSTGVANRIMLALTAIACFGVPPTGPHLARLLIEDERSLSLGVASAALAIGSALVIRHHLWAPVARHQVAHAEWDEGDEQGVAEGQQRRR